MTEGRIQRVLKKHLRSEGWRIVCDNPETLEQDLIEAVTKEFLLYPHTEPIVLDIRKGLIGKK